MCINPDTKNRIDLFSGNNYAEIRIIDHRKLENGVLVL